MSAAWPVLACSCGSYEPVKACQIYQRTPVIFCGRVIDHNHDPTAGFGQMTLYRFKVLEAFKGLSPETREVFINPASMTSCYTEFALDHDYLVFTGGNEPAPAAVTVLGGRQPSSLPKEIPASWRGLEQLPVYLVGGCSPTKTVKEGDPDLGFLRSAAKDSSKGNGWIEGRAVQNFSWPWHFADFVAAVDAILTVTSHSGERRTAAVEADGTFEIGPVLPGTYSIAVQSPVLGNGKLAEPAVEVPSGGCAVANASFDTKSTISGKVLDADGKWASRVRVELGELRADSKVRVIPQTWFDTDQDGNFKISNAPVGRVVLAANMNGAPTAEMPFDSVYVPGTQNVSSARVFAIQPGQEITSVLLRLPRPLPFGDLYVDVKWPDGSPALGGARAFAEWNRARADFEQAPAITNRVKLRLALERPYEIRVDWIDAKPGKFLFVEGAAPQTLDFTRDGQTLELQLKAPRPTVKSPPSGSR
jgi:hypothetical protein